MSRKIKNRNLRKTEKKIFAHWKKKSIKHEILPHGAEKKKVNDIKNSGVGS